MVKKKQQERVAEFKNPLGKTKAPAPDKDHRYST